MYSVCIVNIYPGSNPENLMPGGHNLLCYFSVFIVSTYFADLDECEDRNGGCEATCNNSVGSFSCSCPTGYTLSNNLATCKGEYEMQSSNVVFYTD